MSEWKETEFGKTPKDWSVLKFSEALKIKGRIGWKGYKTSDLRDSGPVVIGGVNIKSNIYLDYSSISFLSREKYEESPEIMLKKGDIILVTRGNGIGDVGLFNGEYLEATINPSVVILSDFKGDSKFLYYFLASPQGNDQVMSLEGGSSIPALYQGLLKTLELPFPEKNIQKGIVNVLSSLDDKINLLHRQNTTLEKMAETLFRHWFVEEAKEEWDSDALGNLFDIGIGRTPPRKEQHWFSESPTDIKWVSIKDMGTSGVFISNVSEYLTQEAVNRFSIPIIPENTVLLSFKMTIGRLAIATEKILSNEAIAHFKVKEDSKLYSEFLYLYLKTYQWEQLGSTSSIVESINSQMIKQMEIFIPEEKLLNAFKEVIEPYFKKIKSNQTQIRTLTALRDSLLPKLMSGEVKVG